MKRNITDLLWLALQAAVLSVALAYVCLAGTVQCVRAYNPPEFNKGVSRD